MLVATVSAEKHRFPYVLLGISSLCDVLRLCAPSLFEKHSAISPSVFGGFLRKMILRALVLAGGLVSAAGLSQFPEFSQQYLQRLGGAMGALESVVYDFDRSAMAAGLTRREALEEMNGSPFLKRRQADLRRIITDFERLNEDYTALRDAGPFTRLYEVFHMTDPELLQATADDFKPAVPLTFEGGMFTLIGYVGGSSLVKFLYWLIPPRRRKRRRPTTA